MFKLAKLAKRTKNKDTIDGPPDHETLKNWIVDAIKEIYDPEIPINIYDLGLIYNIDITDDFFVTINMTLTAPACPVAEIMPAQVKDAVKAVKGVSDAKVKLVWDPPWSKESMTEEAMLQLGLL
ncbi:MAG: SUF system Fe-S cluster assembly protein [Thiotrichaceae bacterium]